MRIQNYEIQGFQSSPGMIEVRVEDALQVDQALNSAVVGIQPAAIRHQVGILISRIGPGYYIVRAHPEVPYGLTRQSNG
jgi:hypothetical protein